MHNAADVPFFNHSAPNPLNILESHRCVTGNIRCGRPLEGNSIEHDAIGKGERNAVQKLNDYLAKMAYFIGELQRRRNNR